MPKNCYAAFAAVVVAATLTPAAADAAGFALQEEADGLPGAAYVGMGAAAQDASTAFYNPAGMTEIKRPELKVGARYFGLSATFQNDGPLPQTGGTGGDAGMKQADPSAYYVRPLSDRFWAGISLNSPFGLGVNYQPTWAGRYFVVKNHLTTYNVEPVAAYKVNEWLSIGGGISFQYATLGYESALNNIVGPDGYSKLDLDAFGIGYNVGVLLTPRAGTRIGLTYRSRVQYDLSGRATFTNAGPFLQALGFSGTSARLKETMPDSASISVYQQLTPKFAVLGDVGWENWSLFKSSNVFFSGGGAISIPRDWHDTVRFGLGFQYNLTDALRTRIGAAYDSSPTGISTRQPDLAIDRQIRVGIGVEYDFLPHATVGFSYEYADLGANKIDIQQNVLTGRLVGHYDEHANVIGMDVRYRF